MKRKAKKVSSYRFPKEVTDLIKVSAEQAGISESDWVTNCILDFAKRTIYDQGLRTEREENLERASFLLSAIREGRLVMTKGGARKPRNMVPFTPEGITAIEPVGIH